MHIIDYYYKDLQLSTTIFDFDKRDGSFNWHSTSVYYVPSSEYIGSLEELGEEIYEILKEEVHKYYEYNPEEGLCQL